MNYPAGARWGVFALLVVAATGTPTRSARAQRAIAPHEIAPQAPSRPGTPAAVPNALTLDTVVASTLARSPAIRSARAEIGRSRGTLDVANAPFGITTAAHVVSARTHALVAAGDATATLADNVTTGYDIGAQRRFRSGVTISPQLEFSREQLGTLSRTGPGTATVGVSVTAPLQRGRGSGLTGATARAAEIAVGATRSDARHAAAVAVLASSIAYWHYVAANARADARRESEAHAARLLEETRALVRADERPASDLTQLQANLAGKTAARIAAVQQYTDARQSLALAMGAAPSEAAALGSPGTGFPDPAVHDAPADARTSGAQSGLTQRGDIQRGDIQRGDIQRGDTQRGDTERGDVVAARQRRAAAKALVAGAAAEVRPRVDLTLGVGYTGMEGGRGLDPSVAAFYRNVPGPNVTVQLAYELPWGNPARRGQLLQQLATDEQSAIAVADLERTIATNLALSVAAVAAARDESAQTDTAVVLYTRSVDNAKQRFRLGAATLFDVILAEDALTAAMLAQIDARERFATALVQQRFEAGRLVTTLPPDFLERSDARER